MIRLHVDATTLGSTRLALSPLWETIGSVGVLARYPGLVPSPYTEWARSTRLRMPAEITHELVDGLRNASSLFPPGFVPVPDPARATIEAELEHVRAGRSQRLATLLERYWECAIAPHWPSVRSSLEEEILFRGRTLAVGGPEAMLAELGGRVSWTPPVLTAPYHRDLEVSSDRARLLLVPMVFAGGLRLFLEEEGVVAMSYQARATGHFRVLTAPSEPVAEDRLALLLGTGRAQVVRALETPRTTTTVAESLGMAKSTVSQHLAVLTTTGLVRRQRVGGQVFYQLDTAGLTLVRQVGR